MPFIDAKISLPLTREQKDKLKTRFGQAISILHKPESYLMINIADSQSLYFAGKALEKGAYVAISVFGQVNAGDSNKMTGEVCRILNEELDIPGNAVYVSYHPVANWGWNGSNF
ncbi:MAG: hypothetical protein II944_06410 [Ruminobacter sp.]|nr:hypothetical protein [Ruminobacter sp.]